MFGLLMNLMAIYTPFPLGSGSIQPKSMDFMTVVLNLLLSSILPMILGLALIPLGIEWLIGFFLPSVHWLPVAVPLSLLAMSGSLFCYRQLVRWQGKLLQSREKEILRIVTSKLE
jgi:membrane protein YdbS with pleckstrin-like domain